jgi:manganese efflux pump family protein
MSAASLFAWIATVLVGLMLLVIWLMEYDPQFQGAAATRLPIPVISTHALLGMAGLLLWGAYLLADEDRLAYATLADLGIAVVLGLTMAGRWVRVYRTYRRPNRRDRSATQVVTVPPERNFPISAVILHGVLATTTVVLVVLTVFTD